MMSHEKWRFFIRDRSRTPDRDNLIFIDNNLAALGWLRNVGQSLEREEYPETEELGAELHRFFSRMRRPSLELEQELQIQFFSKISEIITNLSIQVDRLTSHIDDVCEFFWTGIRDHKTPAQPKDLQKSIYAFYHAEISPINGIVGAIALENEEKILFWTFTNPDLSNEEKYAAEMEVCKQEAILRRVFPNTKFEFRSLTFNQKSFETINAKEKAQLLFERF